MNKMILNKEEENVNNVNSTYGEKPINRENLPLLLSARDAEKLGISKTMYYRLTHMASVPTVLLGDRRYIHRDRFFEWLDHAVDGTI